MCIYMYIYMKSYGYPAAHFVLHRTGAHSFFVTRKLKFHAYILISKAWRLIVEPRRRNWQAWNSFVCPSYWNHFGSIFWYFSPLGRHSGLSVPIQGSFWALRDLLGGFWIDLGRLGTQFWSSFWNEMNQTKTSTLIDELFVDTIFYVFGNYVGSHLG